MILLWSGISATHWRYDTGPENAVYDVTLKAGSESPFGQFKEKKVSAPQKALQISS